MGNGFSDYGTLVHKVLEMYLDGTIRNEECRDIYTVLFDEMVTSPYPKYPPNMRENAYKRGLEYFEHVTFGEFGEESRIIAVEKNIQAAIGPHKFRGVIDLVLEDNLTGQRIIIDHKTKSEASMKKEIETYKKQLYLYAWLHYCEYGTPPDKLAFNMINASKKKKLIVFDFNEADLKAALSWAEDTINTILLEDTFEGRYNDYFCEHICGVRESCPLREEMQSDDAKYL